MTTLSKARLRYLMPIELIKFLKKEKALCAFMNALIDGCSKTKESLSEEYISSLLNSKRAIISLFLWKDTEYWSRIHKEWNTYLNNK